MCKNCHFCHFRSCEFCSFGKYQPSKSAKIKTNLNSEPLDALKWLILHFKNPQNWFHVKSDWYKDHEIFHTVLKMNTWKYQNRENHWKTTSGRLRSTQGAPLKGLKRLLDYIHILIKISLPMSSVSMTMTTMWMSMASPMFVKQTKAHKIDKKA